jgi:hypothetical protein
MDRGMFMVKSSIRVAAGLLIVASSACGTETGVLIEVTRDESVPAEVSRLEFYVGVDEIEGHPSSFIDFDVEDGARIDGRDLAEDPYRLMLRTGDYPDSGIMVAVVAFRNREIVGFGALERPVPFVDGKVTMWSVTLSAELPDGFDITDEDCLRFVDSEGNYVSIGRPGDLDCDGYIDGEGDCNDFDPGVNSGAAESCGNGVDEDCDDAVDENVDDDGDQVTTCDGDCNDGDPAINPSADDACDGIDNNCNGECDDGHDYDGDEFTVCGSRQFADGTCIIDEQEIDCNDDDSETYPGAAEICDGADNDCDGDCEEDSFLDRDGDLYTECGSFIGVCGKQDQYIDCAPENNSIFPGAPEQCNGEDDDCDGTFLETAPCFGRDPDDGTACSLGTRTCVESPGSGAWEGGCSFVPGDVLPVEACDAYDTCVDDPDAINCAIEAGLHGHCDVNFQVSDGVQCAGRAVPLPTGGSTTCTWAMLGGTTDLDGYLVGLVPVGTPDAVPALTLDACDAALRVNTALETPPASSQVVVLVRSEEAGGSVYMALSLTSRPTEVCAPPAGLVCDGP